MISLLNLFPSPTVNSQSQELVDDSMRQYLADAINEASSFNNRYAAEVWLVDMSLRLAPYIGDQLDRIELLQTVHREASRTGLSPELVLSVIHTESTFDQYAVSRAGAQGYMQIMPFWKFEIGQEDDNLTDMETNIRYGTSILSYYIKKEEGNLDRALARYNGSYGKLWYPRRVIKRWDKFWRVP
ncbi:transglycosylase SLT domain-containing protein [Sansalvadorimonas sp. 2012CJ34-2]|uniref:Transglycosylase SLT domain-containing protein n=1 Tax=Parendozoicomonas callyspongiae TaxID=2942213 RepID=A0ABT0PIV5_9GAMM|nr:transglycosylase SLT domain-containing protein [Sansalvadorimonas sp. 2012CJ34-2]MCL6270682.1 transglycosylase SLT domain-containing protein [Sansalvadorimonas sp. 2012CJ34-2]